MSNQTLDIKKAALFLKMHPVTLSKKVATGQIPGAKIGRAWVFIEIDLIKYVRSQYKVRALIGDQVKEDKTCHSIDEKALQNGISNSPSLEKQYMKALGQATKSKPRSSMTSYKQVSGSKKDLA